MLGKHLQFVGIVEFNDIKIGRTLNGEDIYLSDELSGKAVVVTVSEIMNRNTFDVLQRRVSDARREEANFTEES